jgi:hypothetical protein
VLLFCLTQLSENACPEMRNDIREALVLAIENANKSLNQSLQECINFYD